MDPGADARRMQFLDHSIPVRYAYHVQMPDVLVAVQNAWPDDFLNLGQQRVVTLGRGLPRGIPSSQPA